MPALNIIARRPFSGQGGPNSGGGSGNFPYGAAALPAGMSWNYTEGGTREVTGSPVSFSYASVPTVTGTTYDVNSAATWATAVAAAVDGDGIRITADFSITASLANLSRTSSSGGWVLIFTDRKATLDTDVPYSANYMSCTSTNRIADSDTTCYRTITITAGSTSPIIKCSQSAIGYWFCGLKFLRTTVDCNEGIIDLGASTMTQESHMPNRIVIDRCIIDAGERCKRGVNLNSKDTLISGSMVVNATSSPQSFTDSQAISVWSGCKDVLVFNNACSAESECIASGAPQGDIASPFIPMTNTAFIRNYIFKPSAWDSDVTYPLKKNHFETKSASRVLVFGNVFDRFRSSAGGQSHAFQLKSETLDSHPRPWIVAEDLNIVGNLTINQTEGGILSIAIQGSNSSNHLGMRRVTIVHLYQQHGSTDASSEISIPQDIVIKDFPDFHFEHNTVHCKDVFLVMNGAINGGTMARCVIRNNANAKAPDFGPVFSSDGTNVTVLDNQMGSGNWIFGSNAQVSGGASWGATLLGAPHNNIQDTAANMFTDPGTSDYSAKTGGPLDGTATDGFDIGADVPWITGTLCAGVQ